MPTGIVALDEKLGGYQPGIMTIVAARQPTVAFYRFLYERVGGPWYWLDRRRWSDEKLLTEIRSPGVELHVLYADGVPAGISIASGASSAFSWVPSPARAPTTTSAISSTAAKNSRPSCSTASSTGSACARPMSSMRMTRGLRLSARRWVYRLRTMSPTATPLDDIIRHTGLPAGTGTAWHEVSARYRDYAQVGAGAVVTLDGSGTCTAAELVLVRVQGGEWKVLSGK